jgi:hypothetical protein
MKFLISLIPFYGLAGAIVVISTITGLITFEGGCDSAGMVITTIGGILVALFGFISTLVALFTHVDNLGDLVKYKNNVEAAEEFLKASKEHVKTVTDIANDVDDSLLVKSGIDHPIVKAMQTLTSAQHELLNSKNKLNRTLGMIAGRKKGPFGWIVKLYGDGSEI